MKKLFIILLLPFLYSHCNLVKTNIEDSFSNANKALSDSIITPEALWTFGIVGNVTLSPNKKQICYTETWTNIQKNRNYSNIYIINIDTEKKTQLTLTSDSKTNIQWHPNGKKIGFLSSKSGTFQLWEISPNGKNLTQISNHSSSLTGFKYSPKGDKILFTSDVKLDSTAKDMYPDLPLADVRIIDNLMYRHWDSWHDFKYSHVFIADYVDNSIENVIDIMPNERYDAPMNPFGRIEQIAWHPSGKTIVYTCKKMTGNNYATSTNSDLYQYDLVTKNTLNITSSNLGYDQNPSFSSDGKYLAWESMEHDGYESDKKRLFLQNLSTSITTDLTAKFDLDAESISWSDDNEHIYFISDIEACDELFMVSILDGNIKRVTKGNHNCTSVIDGGQHLITTQQSMSHPTDIYRVTKANGSSKNLSQTNNHLLDQLVLGKVEKRWINTLDNKKMLTWVIYPPHFNPNKKYPTLLYCQGGPQSTVSQFFSRRWNFQLMAANGYIVVAPNRRGLPGFGTEWKEQISGDYGGINMQDYLFAIDSLAKEPFVDANNLGAVGASYGGFSVYWLAGNHNKRFKTFIAHCGVFNLETMYQTTEELFFVNWDLKGAPWEKDNPAAQKSYAFSPHHYINKWDTPIMVIHNDKDFRIPYTQGLAAFNSAQIKNIPSRFIYFPEEGHWVLHPQNNILWHREFYRWLDYWLKKK